MPSTSTRAPARTHTPRRRARIGGGLAAVAASAGLLASAAPADAAPSAAKVASLPLLSQGSHGAAVTELQKQLHLDRTGRYSPHTRAAVMRFQAQHHLSVDGIVGPQTRDAILGIKPATVASSDESSSSAAGDYTIPASIVECESGGDYSAVNPDSGAGGAYQIMPSTWAAYGGTGLPQDASPAEQNAIAAKIYASQGASAWSCG